MDAYKKKVELFIVKLFEDKFELSSYYSERFLTYLADTTDQNAVTILGSTWLIELLLNALKNIDKATESVQSFLISLVTLVSKNESQFNKVLSTYEYHLIQFELKHFNRINSISFNLALINQFQNLLAHGSGTSSLVENKIWQTILHNNLHRQSIKIQKATYIFLAKLIWKLCELGDGKHLVEALDHIVKCIVASGKRSVEMMTTHIEESVIDPMLPAIKTVLQVIEESESIPPDPRNRVFKLLLQYYTLDAHLYWVIQATRAADTVMVIEELKVRLRLYVMKEEMLRPSYIGDNFEITAILYNVMTLYSRKRMITVILDLIIKFNIFWTKNEVKGLPSTIAKNGRTFRVRNQFVIILIVPLGILATEHTANDPRLKETFDVFISKITNLSNEHTVAASYVFKDLIEDFDKKHIAIQTIKQVFRLKGYLNNEQAGIVYQALYYTLRSQVGVDAAGDLVFKDTIMSAEDLTLISLVISAIKMLLDEHEVHWYENFEIIYLNNALMNLLNLDVLPTKVLVQALDLIDIGVRKFLPPDLNLLNASGRCGTLREIGNVIVICMQSSAWEVRDSGLVLLLSCLEIAFIKYPPIQKLILESNLMITAAKAALEDPAYYVQATALKCLAASTKINLLWEEILRTQPEFRLKICHIAETHPEGIVRTEATNVLTEIYMNQKLSKESSLQLYHVMQKAALNDMYWEVQLVALSFWGKAIQNQMSYRGMIDNKFPAVTFCTERRKIITLNQIEIEKQLSGILRELSNIGCLEVLHRCLNEDYNVKVMEKAYNISKKLFDILDTYNVSKIKEHEHMECDTDVKTAENLIEDNKVIDLSCSKSSNDNEKVIEEILATYQSDLISEIYESSYTKHVDSYKETMKFIYKMNPNEFITDFKGKDYSNFISAKLNWNAGVSNLNSVLDELLSIHIKYEVES